ncbi:CopY/TcrY family copper transport repressor [Lactobacillus sp. ESL0684]|uniref:CopY/TcrY family copper transport repressor n=1 Tax=Lactobacillus sp. ESL0684 TaxID=2983213 RepID=UPI0023F61E46|nr:CopY/TcrY family copper transport repressor [Lactobacillus sp. ESL0684]WEV43065.1 CopY/TcrY family copper transport repressor [Lactobacillus sp. ESL0684]
MVTKNNVHNISEAEWEVMRIVWTLGEIHTGQVIAELQTKKAWSESTIKTLMGRLVKKGLLKTRKDGRRFVYSATVSENQMMLEATRQMMGHMCDMHKGQMLLELIKDVPLSKSDIEKLEKQLTQKEQQAPDRVDCNCLASEQHDC